LILSNNNKTSDSVSFISQLQYNLYFRSHSPKGSPWLSTVSQPEFGHQQTEIWEWGTKGNTQKNPWV